MVNTSADNGARRKQQRSTASAALPVAAEPAFARHETFAPRYGWLKKGFDAASEDPHLFAGPDAPVELGVGKNMARSIRYWTLAFGILRTRKAGPERSSSALGPTGFGHKLLSPDGWDPYLEDLGSLWLLHWRLLRSHGIATAWRYAFTEFGETEFTVDDLARALQDMAQRRYPTARVAPSSLRKDALCIVQMYAGSTQRPDLSEESIRSPFVQLELLAEGTMSRHFAFRVGEKPGLSPALVAGMCVDYIAARRTTQSLPFSTLLRGDGSPGLALRLSEGALYDLLERAVRDYPVLQLADTAGVIQLSVSATPDDVSRELFEAHYERALVAPGGA